MHVHSSVLMTKIKVTQSLGYNGLALKGYIHQISGEYWSNYNDDWWIVNINLWQRINSIAARVVYIRLWSLYSTIPKEKGKEKKT